MGCSNVGMETFGHPRCAGLQLDGSQLFLHCQVVRIGLGEREQEADIAPVGMLFFKTVSSTSPRVPAAAARGRDRAALLLALLQPSRALEQWMPPEYERNHEHVHAKIIGSVVV
jgi:hypothetical protein